MLTGNERKLYDAAHESNITRLMGEYRETDAGMVRELYDAIREEHETGATVLQFVPIGTHREFRDRYPINGAASLFAGNL